MDSLTQIVLGAAVGNATLGKKIGNKALFYGAIAGTIPDLDVLFGKLTDTITAIEWHRGFSHSILFCIIAAPVLGWLTNKIERKLDIGWKSWSKLFFLGLITHPLLDAFTTWGTQLFWPLDINIAFNSIFVIDPLYTFPFLILTIVAMRYKQDSKKRQTLNNLGLILSSGYLFFAVFVKLVVEDKFKEALKNQHIRYSKISTRPSPMNIVLWNANIETPNSYLIADYSFFDKQPISFNEHLKKRDLSHQISGFTNVKRLISISEGWYIIENKNNNWYFNDLRFGLMKQKDTESSFVFSYLLEAIDDKVRATELPKSRRDAKFLLYNLWERIKGN